MKKSRSPYISVFFGPDKQIPKHIPYGYKAVPTNCDRDGNITNFTLIRWDFWDKVYYCLIYALKTLALLALLGLVYGLVCGPVYHILITSY